MPICKFDKADMLALVFFVLSVFSLSSTAQADSKKVEKFESSVRIAYVPHPAFSVDNGIPTGALANMFECATAYFSHIEFVEMSNYALMLNSIRDNVVDIGLNMARSKQRDQVANYFMDLYSSRILLVSDEESSNNMDAGVLAVKQGSGIDHLLRAKGYQVNTQAYSVERLLEMYRKDLVNSFAESEIVIFDELKALDADEIDYDYKVLAEFSGGAYLAPGFSSKNPSAVEKWKKVAKACTYLAPKFEL